MNSDADRDAAKKHIQKIRASLNVDNPDDEENPDRRNGELETLLNIVSQQLYSKSIHFILEILQNADDNIYKTPTPTLRVTFGEDSLRIDTNEVGFTAANVAAICSAGSSSKKEDPSKTGEKGIGFKAVFKVADIVWVLSPPYFFKLDKKKKLGMIAPEWEADPPVPLLENYSSILLHLANYKKSDIEEVMELDSKLLLFLKKLQRIELYKGVDSVKILSRRKEQINNELHDLIIEEEGEIPTEILRYKVFEHTIPNMPIEEKRPGLTECGISLGFPVSGFETSIPQQVYAYLPVEEYGFTFAIQSNFVLIANREDIDSSCDWNKKIRQFIASAFSDAVDYLITTPLRYALLKFIPTETRGFFSTVAGEIQEKLKGRAILEGEDGQMHEPSSLQYVEQGYKIKDEPLILTDFTASRYLSRHYKDIKKKTFDNLGLKTLDIDGFLLDLDDFIKREEDEFRNKSKEWYYQLYYQLYVKNTQYKDITSFMKLIPLRDGNWTSGAESKDRLFFLPRDSKTLVPKGTEVMFIREELDYCQRHFFEYLGAKSFSLTDISPFIVRLHDSLSSNTKISERDLMEHLVFLFKGGWHNHDNVDLWVVTNTGRCRASQAYLRTFEHNGQTFDFPVLHGGYSVLLEGDERGWASWLKEQLDVHELPRLVQNHGQSFELSSDMKLIMDKLPSGEFLRLLRDHWDFYSQWLQSESEDGSDCNSIETDDWKVSKSTLRKYIMSRNVQCYGTAERFPLDTTIVPTESLRDIEGSGSLRLLDIPHISDSSWSYLKNLGVKTEVDAYEYLKCLINLKDQGRKMKTLSLYGEIQKICATDTETIRREFMEKNLIYIPPQGQTPPHWAAINECVWKGPKFLKRHYVLASIYPRYEKLFSQTLDIRNAHLETFVSEARSISLSDQPDYIQNILYKINDLLEDSPEKVELVQSLRKCAIFPVRFKNSDQPILLSLSDDWFINDNGRLTSRFSGKVPLLVWPMDNIWKMRDLVRMLDIDKHILSENVERRARFFGVRMHLKEQTNALRERAKYIACIIPKERIWLWTRLRDANVYGVEEIITELNVTVSGNNIRAETYLSPTLTINEDESIAVYLEARYTSLNSHAWLIGLSEQLSLYFGIPQTSNGELSFLLSMLDSDITKTWLTRNDIKILDNPTLENYAKNAPSSPPHEHRLFPRKPHQSEMESWKTEKHTSIRDKEFALRQGRHNNSVEQSPLEGLTSTSTSLKPPFLEQKQKPHRLEQKPDEKLDGTMNTQEKAQPSAPPKRMTGTSNSTPVLGNHQNHSTSTLPLQQNSSATQSDSNPPNSDHVFTFRDIAQSISIMKKQERPEDAIGYTSTLSNLHASQNETTSSSTDSIPLSHVDLVTHMPLADIVSEMPSEVVSNVKRGSKKSRRRFILDRVLERNKRLQLAGLNNIVYLASPDDLPEVDAETVNIREVQNLPARYQINREREERILYIALSPSNTVDFEPNLLGEVKISQWLQDLLGDEYNPDRHWTSPMSRQLNHTASEDSSSQKATFTLDGDTRPLTDFLGRHQYLPAHNWGNSKLRYHIEVQTTIGGLESRFPLNAAKIDLARKHMISNSVPTDVFILIRIHDIHTNPALSFYVDPWQMYSIGRLQFQAKNNFTGKAGEPHISLTEQAQQEDSANEKSFPSKLDSVKALYKWSPLESHRYIRLLLLRSGKGDATLQGRVEHVSLNDKPKYFAISYAWGSRLLQFKLKTDQGDIMLTMSLYLALRQIREGSEDIYIWADAICINQSDNKEKANQVSLMQDIFKAAEQVYGWLGPGDPESRLALETLGQIYDLLDPGSEKQAPISWGQNKIPPVEDPAWLAIKKLFDRTWFRRVWIVQEVILASELTLVCGEVKIHWDAFYNAARYCNFSASDYRLALIFPQNGSQAAVVSLGDFRYLYQDQETEGKSMYTLLGEFKRTESSSPRDKLFALLSLATDGSTEGFKPDYDLTLKEVILKYTKVFVEDQGRGTELLHRSRFSDSSSFPSWIPSWTSSTPYPKTISTWGGTGHFSAATHQNAHMKINRDILSVKGQIVDTIVDVGKSPSSGDVRVYLDNIFTFIEKTYPKEKENHQILKWKIPIGAATRPKTGNWGDDGGLSSFEAMEEFWNLEDPDNNWNRKKNKIYSNALEPRPLSEAGTLAKRLWPYLNTVMDFAEIFSPAVAATTKANRVGIVPQAASSEDVIALFSGCPVPFLLRKDGRPDEHYHLIGECYIHGLMHGEFQSSLEPEKVIYLV